MPNSSLKIKISRTVELLELWTKFRKLYQKAEQGEAITPEDEQGFLYLKSQIARRYQALSEWAGGKELPGVRTIEMVARITSLEKAKELSDLEKQKIEADWQSVYITLNRFLGGLEATQDRAKTESGGFIKKVFKVLFSPLLILVYLIILIVAGYLVWFQWMGPDSLP